MVVQHLLEVSVCLLGVCTVLCLAACMTHSLRRHHWNGLDLQNVRNLIFPYTFQSMVVFYEKLLNFADKNTQNITYIPH